MKRIFLYAGCLFVMATNTNAAQVQDLLGGTSTPISTTKAVDMRSDYNINMGQVSHAFDDGGSESGDTVLRRTWSPDSSIAVRLRKNVGTLISIPEGERIQGFVLGDQVGFIPKLLGEKMPNKIVISPTAYEIDTNLTIIDEDNRLYTFYLRSDPMDSEYVPHFSVVVELPGQESKGAKVAWKEVNWPDTPTTIDHTKPGGEPDVRSEKDKALLKKLTDKEYDFLQVLEASGSVNTGYSMYGDSAIAPNAVWDDGKQVYISFRDGTPSSRVPTLYRVIDGYAAIANSHYRDGFLITDGISEEGWMLVDGSKTVCIKAPPKKKQEEARKKAKDIRKVKSKPVKNLSEQAVQLLNNKYPGVR